jgi:hypothetical protein
MNGISAKFEWLMAFTALAESCSRSQEHPLGDCSLCSDIGIIVWGFQTRPMHTAPALPAMDAYWIVLFGLFDVDWGLTEMP